MFEFLAICCVLLHSLGHRKAGSFASKVDGRLSHRPFVVCPLLAAMSDPLASNAGKELSAASARRHSPSLLTGLSADALTNTLRPLTDCFLTIRVIKSFEFRTTKNMLLPHVDVTTMTVGQLKEEVKTREFLR